MRELDWHKGPPSGRGLYWVVINGKVQPCAVEPAHIDRDLPDARLLLKILAGGLAYPFEACKGQITHHAVLDVPAAP